MGKACILLFYLYICNQNFNLTIIQKQNNFHLTDLPTLCLPETIACLVGKSYLFVSFVSWTMNLSKKIGYFFLLFSFKSHVFYNYGLILQHQTKRANFAEIKLITQFQYEQFWEGLRENIVAKVGGLYLLWSVISNITPGTAELVWYTGWDYLASIGLIIFWKFLIIGIFFYNVF